jgi:hypothetical protein
MSRIIEEEDETEQSQPKPLKIMALENKLEKIRTDMQKLQELRDTCNEALQLTLNHPKQMSSNISDLKKTSLLRSQFDGENLFNIIEEDHNPRFHKIWQKLGSKSPKKLPLKGDFNLSVLNNLESEELALAGDGKSSKGSIENKLGSGANNSGKSSTGRKGELDLEMEMQGDMFQDMEIIMENYQEDFSKTHNMFTSLGVSMESEIENMVGLGVNNQKKNEEFQRDFFKGWGKRQKQVLVYEFI